MIAWFAPNMLWASAAMLLVLAIRRPMAAAFGAGAAYALWLVPAARLLAPPAIWLTDLFGRPLPSLPPILLSADMITPAADPAGASFPWLSLVLVVWAAGGLLFLVYQAGCYRSFLRRLSLSLESAGSHEGVPLLASAAVDGPLALGLLDRRIVIPANFEQRYAPAERRLALDHERHHHRRGDILANHAALLVLALNWFNPVAWLAFRAFRADQELACDAAVAASAPAEARADYARALVKSASRPGLIAACPLNHADQLKRRLKMLKHHRKDRLRPLAGAAVTAILVAAGLTAGSPGLAHPHEGAEKSEQRERVIIIENRDGAGAHRDRDGNVVRRFEHRLGDADHADRLAHCRAEGGEPVDVEEGEGNRRTVVRLCTVGDRNPAERAAALQRARERLASDDHLSPEMRQRILARIDEAIARARTGN